MKKIFFIIIAFSLLGCEISEEDIRDTTFADISIVPSSIVIDTQISTDLPIIISSIGDSSPLST